MSQPRLSKWLKDLEDDIGLQLFERHARGLRPTSHGHTLIAHAGRIDASLTTAREDMACLVQGGRGLVRVGFSPAAAADVVPSTVLQVQQRLPGARIRLVENTQDRLMAQLDNGELDIVVCRSVDKKCKSDIIDVQLYAEPINFVCRRGHPLLSVKKPSWDHLLSYQWIVWPQGTQIRSSLETSITAAALDFPQNFIESNSVITNGALLINSDMTAVFSQRVARSLKKANLVGIVPFELPGFASVTMYWRKDAEGRTAVDQTLKAFLEHQTKN